MKRVIGVTALLALLCAWVPATAQEGRAATELETQWEEFLRTLTIGKVGREHTLAKGALTSAVFLSDGKSLLVTGTDLAPCVVDADSGAVLRAFGGKAGVAALSPDGATVAIAEQATAVLKKSEDAGLVRMLDAAGAELSCLAFTPDGKHLVGGTTTAEFVVWDVATGTAKHKGKLSTRADEDTAPGEITGIAVPATQWTLDLLAKGVGASLSLETLLDGKVTPQNPLRASIVGYSTSGRYCLSVVPMNAERSMASVSDLSGEYVTGMWLADVAIHAVAAAPGDLALAAGYAGGKVEIISLRLPKAGKEVLGAKPAVVATLDCGAPVRGLAFSADGAQLAAACGDGKLRLLRSERPVPEALPRPAVPARKVVPTPAPRPAPRPNPQDPPLPPEFKRWLDFAGGFSVKRTAFVQGGLAHADLSPEGALIAAAGPGAAVTVLDAASLQSVAVLPQPAADTTCVIWAPDGQMLVAGDASGTLTAWGRDAWDVKFSQAAHTKAVRSLAWAPDGRHLASGGADGTVKVHDAAGMQKQSYSPGSHARNNDGDTETVFTCVGWSADGRMVHGGTSRSSSYGWSFGEQRGGGSSSTSWGGNARTILFVGAMPGSAKRLDADSTGSIRITEGDGWESGGSSSATVRGLTAVACGRRSLLLWTATQTSLQAFSTHVPVTTQEDENGRRFTRSHSLRPGPVQPTGLSPICALSQSDDGLLLLVAAATGEIQVWSGDAPPQPLGEIDAALDGVVPAAPPRLQILVALGDGLAAGYADGTIRLMDESGRPRRTLVAGTSAITGLWYQAGGRFLLSLDADGEVWRFALEGDHVKRRLKCQARGPEQLALSHDGGLCAAPGKDAVELWDIAENKSVAALAWTGAVHELAFSADSRFLAVRDGADVTVFDCRSMLKAGSTRFEGCTRLWFAGEELVAVCGTDLHRQGWKAGAARTTVSLEADRAAHAGRVQPAGDRVLFAAGPREIRELDASTGRITARVTGTDDFAAWAVLGQRVVTASASGRMLLWKLPR